MTKIRSRKSFLCKVSRGYKCRTLELAIVLLFQIMPFFGEIQINEDMCDAWQKKIYTTTSGQFFPKKLHRGRI